MSAIDRISVNTYDKYLQFEQWCINQPKLKDKYGQEVAITSFLRPYEPYFEKLTKDYVTVMEAPYYVDAYIIRNCPLDFIQDRLKAMYGDNTQSKEKSIYKKILDGELFAEPAIDYVKGKHFTMIKSPGIKRNYPVRFFKQRFRPFWWIKVEFPRIQDGYAILWYHAPLTGSKIGTWDFSTEFVTSYDYVSMHTPCPSIKSLSRRILKWGLPVGAKVVVYSQDDVTYKFIIKK